MGKVRQDELVDPFASNRAASVVDKQGSQNPAFLLPKADETKRTSEFNAKGYGEYMDATQSGSLFNDKTRARNQSGVEQAYHSIKRAGAEVIGGAVSGFGSVGAFISDLVTESSRQEADFNNVVMQLGEDIISSTTENNPIYRENPGKAFDFGDSGYIWEQLPSVASSLSLLIPARGITGGLGMLGKMAGISGKMGKTSKFLAEVGSMSVISRNGENMRESLSVAKQADEKIREQFGNMSEGELVANIGASETGREFLTTGKEITAENYGKFVGAKAGMESYKVNASNIVFDFFQTAIAYKALAGLTRNKNITNFYLGEGGKKLAAAEAEALGKTLTMRQKFGEGFKTAIAGSLGPASEGIEEVINSIGTKEGERVGNIAAGLDKSEGEFGTRVGKYLDDASTWDAGLWGALGGKIFESGAHLMEKITNRKGEATDVNANRFAEINGRSEHVGKITKDLVDLENMKTQGLITDNQYQDAVYKLGNQSAFDMGINAASSGQVDNLLSSINDPAFKNVLLKSMPADQKATITDEKYNTIVQNMSESILEAESVYKGINNKIQYTDAETPVKNYILSKGMRTGYDTFLREKENVELTNQFEEMIGDPQHSARATDVDFRDSIEIEALDSLQELYQRQFQKYKDRAGYSEFINRRLEEIKDRKETLKTLNPDRKALTEDHDDLVALKYKQLGNEFQINTNREVNDNLGSRSNVAQATTEFNDAVKERRAVIKMQYEDSIFQAIANGVEINFTRADLETFGDEDLLRQYDTLQKLKADTAKQEAVIAEKPIEPAIDNTPEEVAVVEQIPAVANELKPVEDGLNKLTAAQKTRILKKFDAIESPSDAEDLKRLAVGLGIAEDSGFMQALEREILPVEDNYEEMTPLVPDVIAEDVVMEEEPIEIEEVINPITEVVTIDEVPIVEENPEIIEDELPLILPAKPEEVIELTEAEVTTDNVEYSDAVLFIPNFHDINDKVVEKSGADYKVNAKIAKTINAIKQLRVGQEYELTIDTKNPYNKDTVDDSSIGIKIDGEYVYYINTVSALRKQLEAATEDKEKLKYTQLLAAVQNIRNKVFNNKDKVFKTRIKNITQGTIIPGTSNLPLDIVAGTWKLAFLDPQNPNTTVLQVVGEQDQYFGTGRETIYNKDANYTKGVEYLLLEAFNFDGSLQSRTPVRLQRNNLTQESANEVFGMVETIVNRINNGAKLNSEEIEDIKSKISAITPVNKYNQERSEVNGQVVYTIPKPYFKIHSNRIEFLFDRGTKLGTVWFKDKRDGVTKFVVNEWNSQASEFPTEKEYLAAKGKVVGSTLAGSSEFQNQVVESLQKRPFNVTYSKDWMTDKDAENLLTSGRISADFGVLRSPSGEPLSNFWAKPEASLVDGAKRYQHGNLAISIDSNITSEVEPIVVVEDNDAANIVPEVIEEIPIDIKLKKVKTNIKVKPVVEKKFKERKILKTVSAGIFSTFRAKDIQDQIGKNLKEGDKITASYYQPSREVNRTSMLFEVVDGKLIDPNDRNFSVENDKRKFPGYEIYEDVYEEVQESQGTFGDTDGIVIEDGLTMLFTGELVTEQSTPEEKSENWKRMFGTNVPIDAELEDLITVKGELAYAVLTTAGAKLFKGAPTGAEYHEAFHAVTQEYLTESQLDELYTDASNIYGKEFTPLQLEEKMAEDFRLYAINEKLIPPSRLRFWFNKIRTALRIIFKGVSRNTIFEKIHSGGFNYKPTARVRQFIKNNPLMMDSNPLNALFTQQEIKQYVEWGTMIVAADLPIVSGKSNREIKDNPNQYNLRLRGKARLRDYHQKLIAKGDTETAKVVERIGENWGSVSDGFWNLIVKNVNRKLKYNIGFNEDQANDFQGNVQMQRDWDDRVAYTVSGKESFDFDLKRIIMLTPKLDNADSEVDADGTITFNNVSRPNAAKLQQPIDFNTVYPMLVDNMADANTVEEMMLRLKELSSVDPSMFYLWNKINNNDLLKQKWFTNFRKNYVPDSHIRFTNLGNDGYSIVSESANPQLGVANQWVSNIQSLMAIANRSEEYNGYTADEIDAVRSAPLATIKDGKLEESIDRVVDLARVLGVGVSTDIMTKIVNNKQLQEHYGYDAMGLLNRVIYNDLNWVATGIANAMKSGSKLVFNERGRVNTLANYVSHYQPEVIENSYLNTQGKVMFSFKKPSYLTEFFAKFQAVSNPFTVNKTQAKQELLAEIKNRLKDKSFLFSNWIYSDTLNNGLLKIKFGEKTVDNITIDDLNDNAVKNFQLFASGDLKETVSGYGAGYTDLSENDWMLTNLLNYLVTTGKQKDWSMYPIMIPSDSGNIWSIKSKRFKAKIVDGKLYRDSRLFKALFNVAQQEMARMAVASNLLFDRIGGEGVNKYQIKPKPTSDLIRDNLIIGYHYKKLAEKDIVVNGEVWFKKGDPITIENGKPTGNVFAFSAMDYGDKSMNQIAELKVGGVFDRIVNNPNNMELVNEYIDEFAENLIKEEVGRHLEFKESLKQSKVKDVSVLNMWSDNFELAVGEYALNTFLFNVEQANFFNGVLPEYKSMKDTAKRAKEVSTTKQTTGFSFRGKTYQAIILKDILLDAQDKEQLEKNIRKYIKDDATVSKIMKKYSGINVADAQGYITLDRMEAMLKDYGRWDNTYDKLFATARNPNVELTDKDLNRLIEVVKPFLYGRNYNEATGVYMSQQVKTSLLPLIPKLYRGTELEKLAAHMDSKGIGEAYFESAVKVGRQKLSDIFTNGRLNKDWDKNIVPHIFQNADWGLQLDVPDHLKDQQNKLGVQIAKLLLANLSNEAVYSFAGNKKSGEELRSMFHDLVSKNIADSSKELLDELGAVTDADGNIQIKDITKISNILKDEIVSRGLSSNYLKAVSVKDNKFVMPLSSTNLRNKFMSILSSLFTSRVTNQKFPGGHVVVASPAMVNYNTADGSTTVNVEGIEFIDAVKDRISNGEFTLKYIQLEESGITKVEALLPAWSTDFFRAGDRININELSEEMRTMIGYRIPTEGKYSTTVIEVVGFLPESSGSTIILPYELIAQTGWDFDVDSVYLMQKVFETKVNGKIASQIMAEELGIEQKLASQYIKEIRKNTGLIEVPTEARDSYDKFAAEQFAFEVIPSGDKFTDARNNTIFDIFKSILESPKSFTEIVNGGNFDDAIELKKRVEELLGENDNSGNFLTRKGQDDFRTNFMAGRALKGMAADVNSALAVLQNVGARFRPGLSFNFKYENPTNDAYKNPAITSGSSNKITDGEIEEYFYRDYVILESLKGVRINTESFKRYADAKLIKERLAFVSNTSKVYLDDLAATLSDSSGLSITPDDLAEFILSTKSLVEKKEELKQKVKELKEGGFSSGNTVNHRVIANNAEGTYTNVINAPITDTAAQILAMSLDIVKEGFPYNLNTYTFNTAMAMIATGVPIMETGLYIRQPILNRLASKIMNNKSVIDDIEEREVVITKKEYQAAMYMTMVKAGQITMEQAAEDNMVDKKTKALVPFSRMKVYFGAKAIARLNLGLDTSKAYSKQELEDMIKMDKPSYRNSSELGKRVDYYREQLNILNQWQTKYYDMGQEFGHVVSSLKADKIGAGPDLNITPEFYGRITREGVTQLTYAADTPAIVYGDTTMSVNSAIYIHDAYPVFKAYLEHSNDTAFQLFSPLFLETRQGYRDLKERLRMGLRLKNSEVVEARLNKFLFKYLFNKYGINNITDSESQRILGLGKEAGKYSDLGIDQYKQLSAAEKLMYLNEKVKYQDGVLQEGFKNAFDILNRLTPKLEEGVVNKRQIHSLSFSKPKSSDNIDDFIIESFDGILNSPNEYIKSLAEDLIKYDLIVNGLTYSANSWREYIPMERQETDGLGQSVNNMMAQTTAGENPDLEDYFARNNWDNVNIVPVAKSKYNYDEQGNRLKEDVDTGAGYEQIDAADADFFNWDAYINTLQPIQVPKDKLSREKKAIKSARYLLIKNQEKSVLLKRFFFNDARDLMEDKNWPVYYYPVNKLGSMYIGNEIGSTSILDSNNFPIDEGEMLMYLESQGIVAAMDLVDANAAESGLKDCSL